MDKETVPVRYYSDSDEEESEDEGAAPSEDDSSEDEEEVISMEEMAASLRAQEEELKRLGTQVVLQKIAFRDNIISGPSLSTRFHEAQDKNAFTRSALFELNAAYEVSERKEDLERVVSEQKKLILATKEYTRVGMERLMGKGFVNGDYSYDQREKLVLRLKEGATNNSIPANRIRRKIFAAFKVAGYEDTSTREERDILRTLKEGKYRIIRMENVLYTDAPSIFFHFRYGDNKGNLKAPIIYHHRSTELLELDLSQEQFYMQIALLVATDLETAPEVFNSIYLSLVVLPKIETSKKLVHKWRDRKMRITEEKLRAVRRQRKIAAGEELSPAEMTETELWLRKFEQDHKHLFQKNRAEEEDQVAADE